jgi:hypothetical protein
LKEAYEKFLIMDALTLEDKKENKWQNVTI